MINRNIDKIIENHYANNKSAMTNLLTNKEYGIEEALVFNNENTKQRGNVLYAPIYMTMFVEKKPVAGQMKYVLDMKGLR